MTKMSWFWLCCVFILYILSAQIFIQNPETILSKHPLTIYSIIVLSSIVLSLRMEKSFKSILLFVVTFFMSFIYISIRFGV